MSLKYFDELPKSTHHQSCSLQFLNEKDKVPAKNFLVMRLTYKNNKQICYQMNTIYSHLQKFMEFIVEKNVSFVLKSVQGNIIGLSINLGIKDLLTFFQKTFSFNIFQNLGIFTQTLKNWAYKLADSRQGDYLFNILTVFESYRVGLKQRIDYFLRAIAFCKTIGWKNLLYSTTDPFQLLKLGGEIFQVLAKLDNYNNNTIKGSLNLQQSNFNLRDLKMGQWSYIVILRLEKFNFCFIDNKSGNQDEKNVYILPKL